MMEGSFDRVLHEFHALHEGVPALCDFMDWPRDLAPQKIHPFHIPAADLMTQDKGLTCQTELSSLRDAIIAAGPHAQWRETYKGTWISDDFMQRFGCYCIIGEGGPYVCAQNSAYMVYMPKGLDYPLHHHPAEEMYYIIAGEAEFRIKGEVPKRLGSGDHVFHPSNAPHATRTYNAPMLALVLWRGDLVTSPVLTEAGP